MRSFLPHQLRHKRGFSLVEIIIVISLFAITSILVTTSYISFEARERLKNGALQVKSDLRLAQNKAQTGDKLKDEIPPNGCNTNNSPPPRLLLGWYMAFDAVGTTATNYKIAGDCMNSNIENKFVASETIKLPRDVYVSKLTISNSPGVTTEYPNGVAVLFRPLDYSVSFHSVSTTGGALNGPTPADTSTLNFTNTDGTLANQIIPATELIVELSSPDGTYKVKVSQSGKIEELRP